MKELTGTEKTFYVVRYNDFENFVQAIYGQEYCFAFGQECSNDTDHEFSSIEPEELDAYNQRKLAKFKETGEGSFLARTLLIDLVNNRHIKPGNYLIQVCW